MTAAVPILKPGGTIIIAAECSEGGGSPEFMQQMSALTDHQKFLKKINKKKTFVLDQWQIQKYVMASQHANIVTVSSGLSPEIKNQMNIEWNESVEQALVTAMTKHGSDATIAIIPQGPYVLSQLEK